MIQTIRRQWWWVPVLLALCATAVPAQEDSGLLTQDDGSLVEPDRRFSEPSYARRYQELLWVLRCPQCDNQAIGDSNAPVSGLMRDRVARLLEEGYSNDAIVDYMIERWGERVTFSPGLGRHTVWILVAGVLAIVALLAVVLGIRRQYQGRRTDGSTQLTPDEQQRLQQLRKTMNKDTS